MPATLTPNYLVGKAVAVSVGGSLAYCMSGNTDRNVVAVKVTNARSGGFAQFKAGIKGASGSITCGYNGDDPPVGMVEGAEVTLIVDFVGYETSQSIENITVSGGTSTPTTPVGRLITMQILITSVKDSWNVEDSYTWSLDFSATGAYTVTDAATGATATT